ncbi:hypothetical protein [Acidithiobacillus acidisediminis]|uniref:hypothetical protein n=1 Tax=Acidithiobacillus TaxID=119977 RepID=UPI0020100573|nr:hypothetical protein [Acidithiobacillus sp. S30A2]
MGSIHFIGGEKGGVGKSLMARVLAQYFIDHSIPFLAFDTDRSHGALLRFYRDYTSPIVVDQYESLDSILEAASADYDQRILVDFAAQTQSALVRWMEESDVLEVIEELGLNLQYWHVMDSGQDSVDLLRKLLDRFADRLRYVLVLNQIRGEEFQILEQSGQKQRALDMGAKIISLKHLHEPLMIKIDRNSSSFWSATQNGIDHEMGLMERQRVKRWLKSSYQEIDRVEV